MSLPQAKVGRVNVFLPTSFTHNCKINRGLSPLVKAVKAKNTHYIVEYTRAREKQWVVVTWVWFKKAPQKRFCRLFRALAESF